MNGPRPSDPVAAICRLILDGGIPPWVQVDQSDSPASQLSSRSPFWQPSFVQQLDLFDPGRLLLVQAEVAAEDGNVGEARTLVAQALARHPGDADVDRRAEAIERVIAPIAEIAALDPPARAAALFDAVSKLDPRSVMTRTLLRRLATALFEVGGDARLEGLPAGHFLLLADDLEDARASLRRAGEGARITALLGDVAFVGGDVGGARELYLRALMADPEDVRFDVIRDPEVAALPSIAKYELEIEDQALVWAGPAGLVTGVLALPLLVDPGDQLPPAKGALADARAFVEAMRRAELARDGDAVVEARRAMKQRSPALFAAYLRQRVAR